MTAPALPATRSRQMSVIWRAKMTKEAQKPLSASLEKQVDASKRSVVLAALSFLSASMGLVLNDTAANGQDQDTTVNKAKTADKNFSKMDGYVQGAKPPGSTGTGGKAPTTTINPALQGNVLQKGTVGGSTGPTKPTLPVAGGQRR
jgi:hypothetical protein